VIRPRSDEGIRFIAVEAMLTGFDLESSSRDDALGLLESKSKM